MRKLIIMTLMLMPLSLFAFSWQDLWVTKNKQAENLMAEGKFSEAEKTLLGKLPKTSRE